MNKTKCFYTDETFNLYGVVGYYYMNTVYVNMYI